MPPMPPLQFTWSTRDRPLSDPIELPLPHSRLGAGSSFLYETANTTTRPPRECTPSQQDCCLALPGTSSSRYRRSASAAGMKSTYSRTRCTPRGSGYGTPTSTRRDTRRWDRSFLPSSEILIPTDDRRPCQEEALDPGPPRILYARPSQHSLAWLECQHTALPPKSIGKRCSRTRRGDGGPCGAPAGSALSRFADQRPVQ